MELDPEQFRASLLSTGFANSAQTGDICPADRKLYALRDVTATVESIPLITASSRAGAHRTIWISWKPKRAECSDWAEAPGAYLL